jgi:hypothetical protein
MTYIYIAPSGIRETARIAILAGMPSLDDINILVATAQDLGVDPVAGLRGIHGDMGIAISNVLRTVEACSARVSAGYAIPTPILPDYPLYKSAMRSWEPYLELQLRNIQMVITIGELARNVIQTVLRPHQICYAMPAYPARGKAKRAAWEELLAATLRGEIS